MAGQVFCKHVKHDGTSCAAKAMPSGYCWFHDPAIKEQRDAARQRGARQTRRRRTKIVLPPATADLPLSNVEEVVTALGIVFNEVRTGAMDARTANCLGLLAGTLLRAFRGDHEVTVNVATTGAGPLLTDEIKQAILDRVKQRRADQEARLIGVKILPPAPNGSTTNGEGIDRAE